jgi:hypothetical protein
VFWPQTTLDLAWLWLKYAKLLFASIAVPHGYGISKISHTEPSQHCIILHWTHMEEMKWFSSAMLGVVAANYLGFGLALAEICQTALASIAVPH